MLSDFTLPWVHAAILLAKCDQGKNYGKGVWALVKAPFKTGKSFLRDQSHVDGHSCLYPFLAKLTGQNFTLKRQL